MPLSLSGSPAIPRFHPKNYSCDLSGKYFLAVGRRRNEIFGAVLALGLFESVCVRVEPGRAEEAESSTGSRVEGSAK